VVKVGSKISDMTVGDRIAFADSPFSNAEFVSVHRDKCIPLPSSISADVAASLLLQGLTAHYLVNDSYRIKKGDYAVVHAAAGGVGQLLAQLISMSGGTVIGLTSSEEKKKVALENGSHHVFLYTEDWVDLCTQISPNKGGVDVVYESVGSTLMQSFKTLKTGGHMVFYGMAGGDPPHVDPRYLMDRSLSLTGGDLWNVLTTRESRIARGNFLFECVVSGSIKLGQIQRFPLAEGEEAHRQLESRKTTGKILLIP